MIGSNSKLYTGTNEHDGREIVSSRDTEQEPKTRKMTMFDLMNMNRKQRRALGKRYGVKIPGINLDSKPIDVIKNTFMKADAPVSSVMDINN